jgi:hypothetical protein
MPTPNEFSNYQFQPNRNTAGGDASPTADAPAAPAVPAGEYPNAEGYGYDASNRQFSQDRSNEPQQLASETAANQSDFAELQQYLNNSLDTPGTRVCHDQTKPWTPPHPEKR